MINLSSLNKSILFFLFLKISVSFMFFLTMPILFNQDVFMYNDFEYYSSGDFGAGRNIGYRWLVWLLGINSVDMFLPILLALLINLSVDIAWIYLFSKHLNSKGLFIFAMMFGLQPYVAVYTFKFSTILFAKVGLFLFCRELFNGGFNKTKQKTLSILELFICTVLTLLRNSNLFIAAPYIFLKLIKRPFFAIFVSLSFSFLMLYTTWYDGLLEGINPSTWPWSLSYVKTLLDIENNLLALIITFVFRVFLLFGAREKLFNVGVEPFLVLDVPGVELCIYILLAFIQLFGFLFAFKFIFLRYGPVSLVMLISIGFAILTVSHQRYLIPYVPICLFGIALFFSNRLDK